MRALNRTSPILRPLALSLLALGLAGCSSMDGLLSGDKLDYRSQAGKTKTLEVPPDLTQLMRDSRYQTPASGSVSANALQSAPAASAVPSVPTVAPAAMGEMRVMREGSQRWLVVPMSPEQLWPQLKTFWQERGFNIAHEDAQAGVMETDWAENRAKIPMDAIRNTLGRLIDSLYSTGERDKFRTRVERTATGSEVYISHRGLEEVYITPQRDQTSWTNRPSDPQLEAEFLSRLMVKLGAKEDAARSAVASPAAAASAPAASAAARARVVAQQPGAALQVDEGFDRAWRRVGLALDRGGFTVEDRDRANGLYYVRYIDPKLAAREEPGFLSRLFSFGADKRPADDIGRYRIALKGEGERTTVAVQNSKGAPEGGENAQRIVSLLVDELK